MKGLLLLVILGPTSLRASREAAPAAPAPEERTSDRGQTAEETFVLENGLSVVVKPADHQDCIVVAVAYRAGVGEEPEGRNGVAHLVEHLVFRGATASFKAGEAEKLQIAAGPFGRPFMDANAETMHDLTYYYSICTGKTFDQALRIEAERMSTAVFADDLLAQERPRAIEEARNAAAASVPRAWQRSMELTYAKQAYRRPKAGEEKALAEITLADCRAFYEAWYAPNNATLVVFGKVDPAKAKELITERFGKIARRELPKAARPEEPDATGERAILSGSPKQVMLTWLSATDVAERTALLLGVYRLLAAKGKLHAMADPVLVYDDPFLRGRSAFTISAFLKPDADPDAAVAEARAWAASLASQAMEDDVFEAARFALTSELKIDEPLMLGYIPKNDLPTYAQTLGQLAINRARLEAGGADRIRAMLAAAAKATAADVKHAATKFLAADKANVVIVK